MKFIDRTGQIFGRLTVVYPITKDGRKVWVCRCQCGKDKTVRASELTQGKTQSCGCLRSECTSQRRTTHGCSDKNKKIMEYRTWDAMKDRCINTKSKAYSEYGGRGIVICDHWRDHFDNFLQDMGKKPTKNHSIDRKNNDGHYSCGHCDQCASNGWPANCRWATRSEQSSNRRNNRVLEFNGRSQIMVRWAEELSIGIGTLYGRLKLGWSVERTLTTPIPASRAQAPC